MLGNKRRGMTAAKKYKKIHEVLVLDGQHKALVGRDEIEFSLFQNGISLMAWVAPEGGLLKKALICQLGLFPIQLYRLLS